MGRFSPARRGGDLPSIYVGEVLRLLLIVNVGILLMLSIGRPGFVSGIYWIKEETLLSNTVKSFLVVATISLSGVYGCKDDKVANNQDDPYPTEEWTVVQAPTFGLGALTNIVWSGSQFVATGGRNQLPNDSGVVVVSSDGLYWTEIHIEGSAVLTALGYDGSRFLTTDWWDGNLYTSMDGLTWAEVDSDLGGKVGTLAWIDTVWLAFPHPPRGGILTSTDGEAWVRRFSDLNGSLLDIAWSDSLIVVVGGAGRIVTSPDAVNWTVQASPTSQFLEGVVWDGSRFLAVGTSGINEGVIIQSNNGIDWQITKSGLVGYILGLATSDETYAMVGVAAMNVSLVAASYDGAVWTRQECDGEGILIDIVWNGTRFVAVGDRGLIVVSP